MANTEQNNFTIIRDETGLKIAAKGNLVASSVQGQRGILLQALQPPPDSVVLSLHETEQLDSLGITLILGLFKSCSKASIPFSVTGVTAPMLRVFSLFNLQKLFPVQVR